MERTYRIIRLLGIASFFFSSLSSFAQEEKFLVNQGNDAYNDGDYIQAQEKYDEALAIDPNISLAEYNTGDVLYKEQKFAEAIEKYKTLTETLEDDELRSKAYHNLGNSYLEAQQYDQSVKALKNSLKLNPSDEDTRYNLAYAMDKLKQQQEQQKQDQNKDQNKDQDKDKDKDKNKDQNKDQDKDQNKDQNKDQDKDKQDQNKDQQDQQQPQPNQMSKEDAERMLDALNNDEKQVQKKMKKKKGKGANEKIEKDW